MYSKIDHHASSEKKPPVNNRNLGFSGDKSGRGGQAHEEFVQTGIGQVRYQRQKLCTDLKEEEINKTNHG